jgi:hypothetical protein
MILKSAHSGAARSQYQMKSITRNIVGPNSKVYSAEFAQAENSGEVSEVITALGLSLEDVNEALRKAKKGLYLASLESTPDSIIANMVAAMVAGGFTPEEAKTMAETKRQSLGAGLPKGLKDLDRVSKRGRKSEADKAEEAKSSEKPAKSKK